MKYSIKTKLTVSYALLALLLVGTVTFFFNVLMQKNFKEYVLEQQKTRIQTIVNLVQKQYNGADGSFNKSGIENIGVDALEQGIILKVTDVSQNVVWDATVHNNGLCAQMLTHMADTMKKQEPGFQGGYQQTQYALTSGGKTVGTAETGFYGPYYYLDSDVAFLNGINTVLLLLGVGSLGLAAVVGTYMARRISRPISKAVKATAEIAKGDFSQRILERSNTLEMVQLTDTVNHLADSLEQQKNLRKRMSADVSHELRTPLANLQSAIEAMMDGVWEISEENLVSCHEEILRLNRLVGQLAKLEQIEAENTALNLSRFDLLKEAKSVATSFEPEFIQKGVTLQVFGDSVSINGDNDKIRQVLINLISNALKYTPEGGEVQVVVQEKNNNAELTVSDTGRGIPPEDLPNIFERFYRGDPSRNKKTGGLGLGLTITRAIVESHKGSIYVESKINQYSKFTVKIPKYVV